MEISSYNYAKTLQDYVCSALEQSEYLQDLSVHFIPENSKDIEYQIKNALQKQGLACVCLTPNLKYIGHNGANAAFDAIDLTLHISEYTPINRAKNKEKWTSGLDLANYLVEYLGGPQGAVSFGKICPKEIRQSEENNLLVTTVTFDTSYIGDLSGVFDWDAENHNVVISPYASQADLDELSGQVQDISAQISSLSPFDPSVLSAYETKEDAAAEHTALSNAISSAVQEIENVDDKLSAYLPLSGGEMDDSAIVRFGDDLYIDSGGIVNGVRMLMYEEDTQKTPYELLQNFQLMVTDLSGHTVNSSLYDVLEDKIGDIESILNAL